MLKLAGMFLFDHRRCRDRVCQKPGTHTKSEKSGKPAPASSSAEGRNPLCEQYTSGCISGNRR